MRVFRDDTTHVRPPPPKRVPRQRIAEFAQTWLASKTVSLDPSTVVTYSKALEQHVLPALGNVWYDKLTRTDVQNWVDASLRLEWTTKSGAIKRYSRAAVHGWFRVFRTMTKDAIDTFELPRDPCVRIRFPPEELSDGSNALTPSELARFLTEMRARYPQNYALVLVLAFTGLRFCHASALAWHDWDETNALLRIRRKHVRGVISPLTKKKRAPRVIPVEPVLAEALREHRALLEETNAPGLELGWMFPSEAGTLKTPNSMDRAFTACLAAAKIRRRFTLHGLRYTFTDLVRLSHADPVVRRALTGHVTQEMQDHYSSVGTDEKRAAIAGAIKLVLRDQA